MATRLWRCGDHHFGGRRSRKMMRPSNCLIEKEKLKIVSFY
jgi:hypothetical protein